MPTKRSACATRRWRPSARRSPGDRGLPCESTAMGNGPAPRGLNTVTSIDADSTGTRITLSFQRGAPCVERMAAAKTAATTRFISVAVMLGLVRALFAHADVFRLLIGQLRQH